MNTKFHVMTIHDDDDDDDELNETKTFTKRIQQKTDDDGDDIHRNCFVNVCVRIFLNKIFQLSYSQIIHSNSLESFDFFPFTT